MASVFNEYATSIGGSCRDFEQTVLINAVGWGAADPKDRGGALATGKGLHGGVCMGLSILYLASRGDWNVFKNTMVSPGGLAVVRGFMNLQHVFFDVGNMGDMQKDTNAHMLMAESLGVKYSGQRRGAFNDQVANGAATFATLSPGGYLVTFGGNGEGHAVAVYRTDGASKIFDPNYGEATLAGAAEGRKLLTWLFPTCYSSLDAWWNVEKYFV